MSRRVSTARTSSIIHLPFAILLLIAAASCAGGSDTTLVLQARTDSLPDGADLETAIKDSADILRQRAAIFGAGDAAVSIAGEEITVTMPGVGTDVAEELMLSQGFLDFRQPVIADPGFVVCTDSEGKEFAVHPLNVNPDSAARNPARCFGDNRLGDPKWDPTPTIRVRTEELSLVDLIEPGSWQIRNSTALAPQFNENGAELLEEVTAGLVGYPLGIFVDDELIAAPRIQRAITNGSPVISGFSDIDARIRHAQLNAGPLPIELTNATPAD